MDDEGLLGFKCPRRTIALPAGRTTFFDVPAAGGDESAPVAMLVHGFPDTLHSWREQMQFLSGEGYRVIVPALRGYEPTTAAPGATSPLMSWSTTPPR